MIFQKPSLRRVILAAGAVVATACASVLLAAPANAATTITLNGGVLVINGDAADNGLIVGRTPAGTITLNGSEVLGGAATVNNVQVVRMDGAGGNDTLRFDESNGAMPTGKLIGGDGRDKLVGGSQADSLSGDGGIDRIDGGPGDDSVSMGDDSDEFTWNPGDGNDRVDGDAGKDTLLFNGSDRTQSDGARFETENLVFNSDGSRTTIRRNLDRQVPLPSEIDVMSFSGFELVKSNLAGGPNSVFFSRGFPGSDIGVVRVDLGPATDPRQNRGDVNDAGFLGTAGADRIRIGGSPAAGATVTGLGPTVIVTRAERLSVQGDVFFGEGGDDVIDAGLMAAGTVGVLAERGDAGNDTLIGHPGNDELSGGPGDDRLEGRGGDDILDGGPGNNVIIP